MNTNFCWRIYICVCYFVLFLSVAMVRSFVFVWYISVNFCKCATHTHTHARTHIHTDWMTCLSDVRTSRWQHQARTAAGILLYSEIKRKKKNQEKRCSFFRTHGWSGFVSRARPNITRASCSRRSAHARTHTDRQTDRQTDIQTRAHHTDGSKSARLCVRVWHVCE